VYIYCKFVAFSAKYAPCWLAEVQVACILQVAEFRKFFDTVGHESMELAVTGFAKVLSKSSSRESNQ
jgi:hypothetical protein